MMNLVTIYKTDGVFLLLKSKTLGKALMNPLPDKRHFGMASQHQL